VPDTWMFLSRAGSLRAEVLAQAEVAALVDLGKPFASAKDTRVQAVVLVRRPSRERPTFVARGSLPLSPASRAELVAAARRGWVVYRSRGERGPCGGLGAACVFRRRAGRCLLSRPGRPGPVRGHGSGLRLPRRGLRGRVWDAHRSERAPRGPARAARIRNRPGRRRGRPAVCAALEAEDAAPSGALAGAGAEAARFAARGGAADPHERPGSLGALARGGDGPHRPPLPRLAPHPPPPPRAAPP